MVVAIVLLVALLHILRIGSHLRGAMFTLYYSYFSDVVVPFAFFFLLSLNATWIPFLRGWRVRAALVLAAACSAELLQGLGVPLLGQTFDLLDFVMYGFGVLLAVTADRFLLERFFPINLALLILLLFSVPASAQAEVAPIPNRMMATPSDFEALTGGPNDAVELERFLDAFFEEQMEAHHIPGAAFVLVKDGVLFFSKGYGFADVAIERPVDPARTLFNLGSVGKLFTATAILQLAEEGRLKLDDPVVRYVDDIPIVSDFAEPVTVAHLLTHTAGFEERVSSAWVDDSNALLPLGSYLSQSLPPVVMPPGEQISYSNHGYGLAGYVVERVSGMPFERYVEEHILAPAGMTRTSFAQPLPTNLLQDLATGYRYSGGFVVVPSVYGSLPPAGGQHATAADMARFMLAQLGDAHSQQSRLLGQDSMQSMLRRHTGGDPRLEGYAYGYGEYLHGSVRALVKGGDSPGYATQLLIIPGQNLGFFVAFNANLGLSPVREELNRAFFQHYYYLRAVEQPEVAANVDLRRFNGSYRLTRYARTTIDKALAPLQMIQPRVQANDDTITVIFPTLMGLEPTEWIPVAPLLFREVEGMRTIGFWEDEQGLITHLYMNIGEPALLERVPRFETTGFQLSLLVFFLLVFLSTLLWPLAALWRRLRGEKRSKDCIGTRARLLAGLLAGLNLIFLVGVGLVIIRAQATGVTLLPAAMPLLLAIPLLTLILAIGVLFAGLDAWRQRRWSPLRCLHYMVVATTGVFFIGFVHSWNLLGFHF